MKNNHESEEILACFKKEDLDQFHTGKIERIVFPKPRDIAHSEKIPHVISRIYAVNENGEYLVQKRSKNKNAHPGLYTDSASGHIRYHDNFNYEHIQREAARELEEEMGTSLLYHRLMDIRLEEFSNGGWELAYNILGVVKNQCNADPSETSPESGFKTKNELIMLLKEKKSQFVKITHLYWTKIIKEDKASAILEEYKKNERFDRELEEVDIQNFFKEDKLKYIEESDEEIENYKEKNIVGAFIGRFQPFHNGHLKVILHGLKLVDLLKIGIGSSQYKNTPENPFSFEERKEMIEKALKALKVNNSKYEIYGIEDKHDIKKWVPEVLDVLGDFDVLFSNSPWIRQLFLKEKKKVANYMKFNIEEYNGTKIRERIKNGRDISDLVPAQVEAMLRDFNAKKRIRNATKKNK